MRELNGCTDDDLTTSPEHEINPTESESVQPRSHFSPDISICRFCLAELFDPRTRYYHYPFLNCTQCGPRLPITQNIPYDRSKTYVGDAPLCIECKKECSNPDNRRYHAQSTTCSICGPELTVSVKEIATALSQGKIIALKGPGGYQLFCDARKDVIRRLRQRKNRKGKPFAVMVANSNSARSFVEMDSQAQALLESPARPIVLLKKSNTILPQSIAHGLSHLGIMLPSTALHYLIFHALAGSPAGYDWLECAQPSVLIITSANLSGTPPLIDDDVAVRELSFIADQVVSYPHRLITRLDDSVMQIVNNAPVFIRRARGFIPEPIQLPHSIPSLLALGGHHNNTFCITRKDEAFVSQYIGSLNNRSTIEFFHESLAYWMRFFDIKIERIACDLHPDFYTTRLAQEYNLPTTRVPQHHAHLAAVAAEHHILKPALGLVLGGYGTINGEGGGELLLLHKSNFQRISTFSPIPLPGSNTTTQEPWQAAASILELLGMNNKISQRFSAMPLAPLLANILKTNISVSKTSSCEKLFDAAGALLGVNLISDYEGQAMMQLKSLVTQTEILPNGWHFNNNQFNLLPTFRYLLDVDAIRGANLFHGTLVAGLSEWIISWANKLALSDILLSGGCFLNNVLSEGLEKQLTQSGLNVYLPQRLPSDEGGLSLGQAWIAGIR